MKVYLFTNNLYGTIFILLIYIQKMISHKQRQEADDILQKLSQMI